MFGGKERSKLAEKAILIVEDDMHMRITYCRDLRASGARTVTAASAKKALAALDIIQFDAVITDWSLGFDTALPVIDFCREHNVPIILITDNAMPAQTLGVSCPIMPKKAVLSISAAVQSLLDTKMNFA